MSGIQGQNSNKWDVAAWVFLCLFALTDLISISAAQIAGTGLVFCWGGQLVSERRTPFLTVLKWPFTAFVVSSLVSAFLSLDPASSIKDSKDLLHILLFFAAYEQFRNRPERVGFVFRLVTVSGGIIAAVGLFQVARSGVDIFHRISGFQGMYMTYAGLLMLAIVLGCAVIFFDFKKWRDSWIPLAVVLMTGAVVFSLTRNAWVGIFVGISTLAALRKPFALVALPLIGALVFFIAPKDVQNRVTSIFDSNNVTNKERVLLWEAGFDIVADYPVFGVGQNSFPLVYPEYSRPDIKEPSISHLHNNFLEIAVERGLVGLMAWLSVWFMAILSLTRGWANNGSLNLAIAGCAGALFAFLAAGMFEYNFGDSEIQMLVYITLAAGVAGAEKALERKIPENSGNAGLA